MALLDDAYALIAPTSRSIGFIVPDCTFEERHVDRVALTEHPVMTGAAVSDHSFSFPPDLVMRIGFSNSTARTEGWVQQAYQLMLGLQQARQPFSVSTGKRPYSNMIITELDVETDEGSEWALNCVVTMRQVNFVSTQSVAATSGIAQASSDQAMPQTTAAPTDMGQVQLGTADGAPTFAQSQAVISSGDPNNFGTIAGGESFQSVPPSLSGAPTGSGGGESGTVPGAPIILGDPGTPGEITVPGPKSGS